VSAIFHVVGGDDDGFSEAVVIADNLPRAARRVCGSRPALGLVEEQHFGVVHQWRGRWRGRCNHASREGAGHMIGAVGQLKLPSSSAVRRSALAGALAEVGAVEQQDLAGSEGEIEVGRCRHHRRSGAWPSTCSSSRRRARQ